MKDPGKRSAAGYVLESLLPFTDANLKLVFRPNEFFKELERTGNISADNARNAYYRAKSKGLIAFNGTQLILSDRAHQILRTHTPTALPSGQCLMVIFDIPEEYGQKRRQLRSLLRELKFSQEQRSVWTCAYDHRDIVSSLIEELHISLYAKVFLSQKLS